MWQWIECDSRMSPRSFGKVMTGGPVRWTGAQDVTQAWLSSAAVPKQRRSSTLEFHRFSDAPTPPSNSNPAGTPRAAGRGQSLSQRMSPERRRLTYALLLSLLIHTLLLSLNFGGQGFWVPSFGFPWQVRSIEVPDLRVVLVPPDTAVPTEVTPVAEPSQQAWVEQPFASGSVPTPSVSRVPTPGPFAAAILSEASPSADAKPSVDPKPRAGHKPGTTPHPK